MTHLLEICTKIFRNEIICFLECTSKESGWSGRMEVEMKHIDDISDIGNC